MLIQKKKKKIKTKNILADSRKLKCQEKTLLWTDDDILLLMEATQNLKVEKDQKAKSLTGN